MRCVDPSVSSMAIPLSNCTRASAYLPCLARATPRLKSAWADLGDDSSDFLYSETASFPRPAMSSAIASPVRAGAQPGSASSASRNALTASSCLPRSWSMSPLCTRASAAASPLSVGISLSYAAAASSYLSAMRIICASFSRYT